MSGGETSVGENETHPVENAPKAAGQQQIEAQNKRSDAPLFESSKKVFSGEEQVGAKVLEERQKTGGGCCFKGRRVLSPQNKKHVKRDGVAEMAEMSPRWTKDKLKGKKG